MKTPTKKQAEQAKKMRDYERAMLAKTRAQTAPPGAQACSGS